MLPCAAAAKTMYITDNIKITMRRGAGMAYKVIAEPESGQVVEILSQQSPWTNVKLIDGQTGWVLSQFLTSKQPKEVQLKIIQEKQEELLNEVEVLKNENTILKQENQNLTEQSAINLSERDEAVKAYEKLKNESREFIQIKDEYEKTADKLAIQKKKADKLEAKMSDWKWKAGWFLGGAGILLIGFALGRNSGGRRSSYLR